MSYSSDLKSNIDSRQVQTNYGNSRESFDFATRHATILDLKPSPLLRPKYFADNGTTNPENLTKGRDLMVVGFEVDDAEARLSRIKELERLTSNFIPNLSESSSISHLLNEGDKVLCSLSCSFMDGLPVSTAACKVTGDITVHLIMKVNGKLKLHFAVIEGQYSFQAAETFTEFVNSAGTSYCCCFGYSNSVSYGDMVCIGTYIYVYI